MGSNLKEEIDYVKNSQIQIKSNEYFRFKINVCE
jgi:hypothetical protein